MRSLFLLFLVLSAGALLAAVRLEKIASGFKSPVYVLPYPGDADSLLVVEQKGTIRRVRKGEIEPKPYLDISGRVLSGGEMGLLSMAFDPNFPTSKQYYVFFTAHRQRRVNVVARYQEGSLEETMLLEVPQPASNHNGGQLQFGPDGYLYIGRGDGGFAGDPYGNGQDTSTLLGKILRIDASKSDKKDKTLYQIPLDNPFANGGGRPEIFAWGIRNPWRFSFDRKTKLLIAGDVGQDKLEEIDIIEKGKNYGWRVLEGSECFQPRVCDKKAYVPPLYEYGRDQGYSITGGYVYRGKSLKELDGVYIYGDFGTGKIWGLEFDQVSRKVAKNELLLASQLPIASFGEDAQGEILVVSYHGAIYRIVAR